MKYWIIALFVTLAAAYYQRITGPIYPIKAKVVLEDNEVKCKLLRSAETSGDVMMEIPVPSETSAVLRYKRYNTSDSWTEFSLQPIDGKIKPILPVQPAAGKLVYEIELIHNNNVIPLHTEAVVIRFKDPVPAWALIPHVILIFLAMLLSNLTGLLALYKKQKVKSFVWITVIVLFAGGMIMGPIVQKFAFGEYWTGVPFGWDLTDNKTLIAMLVWGAALIANLRKPSYGWIIAAAVVMLIIFLIPHSMFGSELDYATGVVTQG